MGERNEDEKWRRRGDERSGIGGGGNIRWRTSGRKDKKNEYR